MLQKITKIAKNAPAIFTGDLNGSHKSEPYQAIATSGKLKDSYNEVKNPYVNNVLFNAFGKARPGYDIIDHIFITKDFRVKKLGILTDSYFGKFPSDHFPVLAIVELK